MEILKKYVPKEKFGDIVDMLCKCLDETKYAVFEQGFLRGIAAEKGWLPPAYGRKAYQKMDREEREVVDSFEGKDSYAETCSRPGYYLYEPKERQNMLESMRKQV